MPHRSSKVCQIVFSSRPQLMVLPLKNSLSYDQAEVGRVEAALCLKAHKQYCHLASLQQLMNILRPWMIYHLQTFILFSAAEKTV